MFKKKIYNYKLNTLGIEYFKRVIYTTTLFLKREMGQI